MSNQNSRLLRDATLVANVPLPNAGNTVVTNAIDLGATTPYPVTESFFVNLSIDAAAGANNKNINARIQDSADGVTFANIALINQLSVADNNGAGSLAANIKLNLPPGTRRYIRGIGFGEANGANSANSNLSLFLTF